MVTLVSGRRFIILHRSIGVFECWELEVLIRSLILAIFQGIEGGVILYGNETIA